MNSKHLKCALLSYFRYKRQYICVDECNSGFNEQADVLVDTGTLFLEIEIKVSKADLCAEKNKTKHKAFKGDYINKFNMHVKPEWGANKFSLCVPEELKDYALKWIEEVNPKYGLIIYLNNSRVWEDRLQFVKNARFIHKEYNEKKRIIMMDRLASALANSYANEIKLIEDKKKIQKDLDLKNFALEQEDTK